MAAAEFAASGALYCWKDQDWLLCCWSAALWPWFSSWPWLVEPILRPGHPGPVQCLWHRGKPRGRHGRPGTTPLPAGNPHQRAGLWIARPNVETAKQRLERQLRKLAQVAAGPTGTGWPAGAGGRLSRDWLHGPRTQSNAVRPGIRPAPGPAAPLLQPWGCGKAWRNSKLSRRASPAAGPIAGGRPKPWAGRLLRSICRDAPNLAQRCRLSQRLIEELPQTKKGFAHQGEARGTLDHPAGGADQAPSAYDVLD